MAWHIVEKNLEELTYHSTLNGKFWIVFFFILRFLMVISITDTVFGDELSTFKCDTQTPGCLNVCFNAFTPISLMRYWAMQILASAMPSLIFMVYVLDKQSKIEIAKKLKSKREKQFKQQIRARYRPADQPASEVSSISETSSTSIHKPKKVVASNLNSKDMPPKVFLAYVAMVLARSVIELGFVIGQYYIYPFKFVVPQMWTCPYYRKPCANMLTSCYIARPLEKTIFIGIMYGTAVFMIVLSCYELHHIGIRKIILAWKRRHEDITKDYTTSYRFQPVPPPENIRRRHSDISVKSGNDSIPFN